MVTRARNQRSSRRLNALAASVLVAFGSLPAYALDPTALPTGGQVAAGSAAISQSGAQMDVNQATQRAIINWQSFNIGANASCQLRTAERFLGGAEPGDELVRRVPRSWGG
jgi:large exoprotein involved in heme utilization and adhesion